MTAVAEAVSEGIQTVRYARCDNSSGLVAVGVTDNIGIHCFVLETILEHGLADPNGSHVYDAISHILASAVREGGHTYWRWEKKPSCHDYLYPPDWDDIAKALDCLHLYSESASGRAGGDAQICGILNDAYWPQIRSSVYESPEAGLTRAVQMRHRSALFMFLGRQAKPNNTEDPMVSVNCLRMLARHRWREVASDGVDLYVALVLRLLEIAQEGIRRGLPFSAFSKCYFSWAHYLLRLHELVAAGVPTLELRARALAAKYLHQLHCGKIAPEDPMEGIYGRLLAARADCAVPRDGPPRQVPCWPAERGILYQHRRLAHFYGSSWWYRTMDAVCTLRGVGGPEALARTSTKRLEVAR